MKAPFSTSIFAVFRCKDFSLLTLNQCCLTFAVLIQEVLIAFQLYKITQNPLMIGLVGLMEFVPFVLLSLWGGYIADRFNRQKILQLCFAFSIPLSALLWLCFWLYQQSQISQPYLLFYTYSLLFLFGCIRGIYSPCFNSLRPFLVPRRLYTSAATWTSLCWQFSGVLAPILGGLFFAHLGLNTTFFITVILFSVGSLSLWCLSQREFPKSKPQSIHDSLKEAIGFIYQSKILFWAIFLDLASVFFGGIIALLPIFAQDILHLQADGFGLLRASPAIGALVMMSLLVKFPPTYKVWRTMLVAVAGFACCTLLFSLTRHFYMAVIILFCMGACDSVSIVIRQNILQLIPPQHMLGRVAAINGIFVTSSNELGALQSSFMARFFTVIPAMLIGGTLSLATVTLTWLKTRHLTHYHFPQSQEKHDEP